MSSNAIEILKPGTTALIVSNEQLALAKQTVAKGLNDQEFNLFLYNCQRQGIHPLDGLLVPQIRTSNGERRLTFVTTVDLLRSRASETNEYAGNDDPAYEIVPPAKNPQSATVTVWRFVEGQRCPYTATARWDEYFPGEKQGFMWLSKPYLMLGKCAEALALRKAFPKQLAGMYAPEEMERPDLDISPAPEPIKPTTRKVPAAQAAAPTQPQAETKVGGTQPAVSDDVKYVTEAQRKRLFAIKGQAGMPDDMLKEYLATLGIHSSKNIPMDSYESICAHVQKFGEQEKEPF